MKLPRELSGVRRPPGAISVQLLHRAQQRNRKSNPTTWRRIQDERSAWKHVIHHASSREPLCLTVPFLLQESR